jgi:hypothetical protein
MATNILALPLAQVSVMTGTNEDWLDSFQYRADDGVTPIDLIGISFDMEVRAAIDDPDVVVAASTNDGRLVVGGQGNSFLLISIPLSIMEEVPPNIYVGDIVAHADGYTRTVIQVLSLTVFQGITRAPFAWEES